MKIILFLCFLTFTLAASVNCQQKEQEFKSNSLGKSNANCSENSDRSYNRQKILEQIANMLNTSIPESKEQNGFSFSAKDEKPVGFRIYDLTDDSNKHLNKNDCVNFINDHIYHVFPSIYDFSFSHIIILEGEKLKVFHSINCKNRGNTVEEVLSYI